MARKKHIDVVRDDAPDPGLGERTVMPAEHGSEKAWQAALRPRDFDEYIGQRDVPLAGCRLPVQPGTSQKALGALLFGRDVYRTVTGPVRDLEQRSFRLLEMLTERRGEQTLPGDNSARRGCRVARM